MKNILGFLIWLVVLCQVGQAQNLSASGIKKRTAFVQTIAPIRETIFRETLLSAMCLPMRNVTSCSFGFTISSRSYIWSVNKTAGTYRGVQTIDDNIPSIGGAGPEGTAYYIDGVRVRTELQ